MLTGKCICEAEADFRFGSSTQGADARRLRDLATQEGGRDLFNGPKLLRDAFGELNLEADCGVGRTPRVCVRRQSRERRPVRLLYPCDQEL